MFAWLVSAIGVGRIVMFGLAFVGISGSLIYAYVKGRIDCSNKYMIELRDAEIKQLGKQIGDIESAGQHASELYEEFSKVETENEKIEVELGALDDAQCISAEWLRELSRIK